MKHVDIWIFTHTMDGTKNDILFALNIGSNDKMSDSFASDSEINNFVGYENEIR